MKTPVPVVLFTYNRPDHLNRTLEGLRANTVPLIYAFSDAPRSPDDRDSVIRVRDILRQVDWCEVVLYERERNLGLGQSILAGVTQILKQHDAAVIFEDDLVCVPGTYEYICAALSRYKDDTRVMSVTGWTHPRVTPQDVVDQPYFDGRAECLVWATWPRAWRGMMDHDAQTLVEMCRKQDIDVYRYGADLPAMARAEKEQNIWAVRWLYWHVVNRGLCLRPPWSMVEHIGWDTLATNAASAGIWASSPLRNRPPLPAEWPPPVEHPDCYRLWQGAFGARPTVVGRLSRLIRRATNRAARVLSLR